MNDSFSGKNGKVKVMFVRSDDDSGDNRNKNKRPDGKGRPADNARSGRAGQDKARGGDRRGADPRRSSSESDRPRRPARTEDSGGYESPWKTVSRAPQEEPAFDHGGISGKSFIDPEQLRRQRAEETRVYGENACKALFASRPDAIVRAWFVQSVTPRFREALRWMAANRKAYHVVDEEELAKASGTEHHGGVCFLIKKRQGLDAQAYLQNAPAKDCVLALEEVGNPHNLGAIVRSCAHFGVNGVLLQDQRCWSLVPRCVRLKAGRNTSRQSMPMISSPCWIRSAKRVTPSSPRPATKARRWRRLNCQPRWCWYWARNVMA